MNIMGSHQASKSPGVAGLENLGNTCFANSVLQCLIHTAQFADNILRHFHNCASKEFCMMCRMEVLVTIALNNPGKILSPYPITNNLSKIAEHFEPGQQQDANKFFQYVVNKLRQSIDTDKRFKQSENPNINKKWIDDIFVGSLRSRVVCQKCYHNSDRYEEFIDIPLNINTSNTIEEALDTFVEAETLSGDNAYRCSLCDMLVHAKKTCTIHRAPEVLTLSLQRFNVFTGLKLNKRVKYPDKLKITNHTSCRNEDTYKLYGVLVHKGPTSQSGHYFAYVKASDHQWYLTDDSTVTPCDTQTALDQEAYLLFYKRIPNNTNISEDKTETNGKNNKRKAEQDSSMDHPAKQFKKDSNSALQHQEETKESAQPGLSRKIILKRTLDTNISEDKTKANGGNNKLGRKNIILKRKLDTNMSEKTKASGEPPAKKFKTDFNSAFQQQDKTKEYVKAGSGRKIIVLKSKVDTHMSEKTKASGEPPAKQFKTDFNSAFQHQEKTKEYVKAGSGRKIIVLKSKVDTHMSEKTKASGEPPAKQFKTDFNSAFQHQEKTKEYVKAGSGRKIIVLKSKVDTHMSEKTKASGEPPAKMFKTDFNSAFQQQEKTKESVKAGSGRKSIVLKRKLDTDISEHKTNGKNNKRKAEQDKSMDHPTKRCRVQ